MTLIFLTGSTQIIFTHIHVSVKFFKQVKTVHIHVLTVAAFRGMHVSPTKHRYVWLPRKWQAHRQTDRHRDRRQTKWSLCAPMLRRRHKNCVTFKIFKKTNDYWNCRKLTWGIIINIEFIWCLTKPALTVLICSCLISSPLPPIPTPRGSVPVQV